MLESAWNDPGVARARGNREMAGAGRGPKIRSGFLVTFVVVLLCREEFLEAEVATWLSHDAYQGLFCQAAP